MERSWTRFSAARRDVRQLLNVRGVSHHTARSWISVLEASFIVHQLQPHFRNFSKRLVKTPKLYFCDPGLAAWLMGVQNPSQLVTHPQRGALFETWVVSELLKARFNRALASNLYFWRDRSGQEVDLVIEQGQTLVPVEVKSGQTVTQDFFLGLERWREIAGEASGRPWLVYGGTARQGRSVAEVLPWREIGELAGQVTSTGLIPSPRAHSEE